VYVLDDGQATGYAGAVFARQGATFAGLTVAGSARWSASARGYRALASRIARARADSVVLSGCVCSNGAALVTDLRRVIGGRVTLIGTDDFALSNGFSRTRAFDGVYLSAAGMPALALGRAGRAFLHALAPTRRLDDFDPAVAYASQATAVVLDAIARSDGTRASVARQVLETRLASGITGPVGFTSDGDPVETPIAINRIDSTTPPAPHRSIQGLAFVRVVQPRIPRSTARAR
jgi:branched-chain amino acid transport system substrate-binding protein